MTVRSAIQYRVTFFIILSVLLSILLSVLQTHAKQIEVRKTPVPNLALLYEALIGELHRGGTVVYFVPFETQGRDQTDQPSWWKECAISRMISAHGLEQAAAVRRAILQLNLEIQFVESSEACTALSTQTYLVSNRWLRSFITPDLNPVSVLRQAGLKDDVIKMQALAHFQTVMVDSVKLLFGFPMPLSTAPHPVLSDLAEGESAVFRLSAVGEPILLARLNWRQWQEMGDYFVATKITPSKTASKQRT
jgi:hypothetical protein